MIRKKCCLLTCFDCAEPPRGETAVSVAAQIERNAFREVAENESAREESAEAADNKMEDLERRLDKQEEQLERVTVILEKLAANLEK